MCQVAVALAKEIELPRAGQEPGAAAEAMAARLMDSWGVGEAGCNDGTVLLLSQRPRQVQRLQISPASAARPGHQARYLTALKLLLPVSTLQVLGACVMMVVRASAAHPGNGCILFPSFQMLGVVTMAVPGRFHH